MLEIQILKENSVRRGGKYDTLILYSRHIVNFFKTSFRKTKLSFIIHIIFSSASDSFSIFNLDYSAVYSILKELVFYAEDESVLQIQ